MTPREPDRYEETEERARALLEKLHLVVTAGHVSMVYAALRAAYAEGWNMAVAELEKSPAAAPAAGFSNADEPFAKLTAPPSEPAAHARDPCQRCGKLGGHVVDFRFDGILMGSWICPHCLAAQEKRIKALEAALRELSRRASDPDLLRGIFGARLMLEGAVKEADALLAARAATASTPGDGGAET